MMKTLTFLSLGFAVALAGCASSSGTAEDPRAQMMAMRPAIDSVPSSGLGPQELQAEECGLFLWSKTDVSKFIFFSKALSGTALFAQGETPVRMTQTTAGGDIFGQFNTRMEYVTTDNRAVELTLVPGEMLEGGQRIDRGMLSLADKEGWLTKLPILGVRACKAG
ncbi:MAG: hypothetical protein AAF437_09225 [Pseudomonadota bacterium]